MRSYALLFCFSFASTIQNLARRWEELERERALWKEATEKGVGAVLLGDEDTRTHRVPEKRVLHFTAHEGGCGDVEFSATGAALATGGHDRLVKVWDATTGANRLVLTGEWLRKEGGLAAGAHGRLASDRGPRSAIHPQASRGACWAWRGRRTTAWCWAAARTAASRCMTACRGGRCTPSRGTRTRSRTWGDGRPACR